MRLVLMLVLVIAAAWVIVGLARGVRTPPAVSGRVRAVVARVKEIAWDHRELEPVLAGAVIDRVRAFELDPGPEVLDDLLEIAWEHREGSQLLSEILISEIRRQQPPPELR
jgi:hypothetical protein